MKKLIIGFSLLISSTTLFGQDKSYVITDEALVGDISIYITAIEKANWDKYRIVDERRVITFKKGVKIELLSANEMTEKGIEINLSKVMKQSPKGIYQPIFVLNNNGFIIEQHSYIEKRK
tara:strand:- start:1205 stop:1564 length:360 start_codon:yes stop_codon:yes gene_type:complete